MSRVPTIGRERMMGLRSHLVEDQDAVRKALNPPDAERPRFLFIQSVLIFGILVVSMFALPKHTGAP